MIAGVNTLVTVSFPSIQDTAKVLSFDMGACKTNLPPTGVFSIEAIHPVWQTSVVILMPPPPVNSLCGLMYFFFVNADILKH